MTVTFSIAGVEIPNEQLEDHPLLAPLIDEICRAVRKRLTGN